ncbi:MAG TPA: signal peptidase I [Pyrinomonadaceae bacterium]|jgi:signal peptidase I
MNGRVLKAALLLTLAGALGGCGAARGLYYAATQRVVKVTTEGMAPTVKPGEDVVVDPTFYVGNPVRRFDVVVFRPLPANVPDAPGSDEHPVYLQRVLGLGGETLEVRGGLIYVDGLALEEPFDTVPLSEAEHHGPLKIPQGELFLMGDNRRNSYDSRHWPEPTLAESRLLGKVVKVLPR